MKRIISVFMVVSMLATLGLQAIINAPLALADGAWTLSPNGVSALSAGPRNSAFIRNDGSLWTFGWNYHGQNGNSVNNSSDTANPTPYNVLPGTTWKSVASGGNPVAGFLADTTWGAWTSAIKADGSLWGWGWNQHGMLGLGTMDNNVNNTPQRVGSTNNWASVYAGRYHSVALTTDGSLYTWGAGGEGQLGLGSIGQGNNFSSPQLVGAAGDSWLASSAGYYHTAAIKSDGSLWVWGGNGQGQVGDGATGSGNNRPSPILISSAASVWSSVSAGGYHTMAIDSDGNLWAWGAVGQDNGQLGVAATATPVQITVPGVTTWKSVSAGAYHTMAIAADGSLWAWGAVGQDTGQLGISATSTPTRIGSFNDWVTVDAGMNQTLATRADSSFYSWGQNTFGQLGTGSSANQTAPYLVVPTITISSQPQATTTVSRNALAADAPLSVTAFETRGIALAYQWFNADGTAIGNPSVSSDFSLPTTLSVGEHSFYVMIITTSGTPTPTPALVTSAIALVNVVIAPTPNPVDLGSLSDGDYGPGDPGDWYYKDGVLTINDGANISITGDVNEEIHIVTDGNATVDVVNPLDIGDGGSLILGPGVTMNIDDGTTVTIDSGGSLTNDGTINVGNGGTVNIDGGTLDNNGTIDIDKGGSLDIGSGGTLNNNNGATVDNDGDISNSGNINNGGTLINNPPGIVVTNPGGNWTGTVPTWKITLGQSGVIFPTVIYGYSPVTPITVVLINSGNQPSGELTLTLGGANPTSFTIPNTVANITPNGGRGTFDISPVSGLPAGSYTATLTVSSPYLSTPYPVIGTIRFMVNQPPTISIGSQSAPRMFGQASGDVTFSLTPANFGSPAPSYNPVLVWTGEAPAGVNAVFNTAGTLLTMTVGPNTNAGTYPFDIMVGTTTFASSSLVVGQTATQAITSIIPNPAPINAFEQYNRLGQIPEGRTPQGVLALANLPSTVTVSLTNGGTAVLPINWSLNEYLVTGKDYQITGTVQGNANITSGLTTTVIFSVIPLNIMDLLPTFSDTTVNNQPDNHESQYYNSPYIGESVLPTGVAPAPSLIFSVAGQSIPYRIDWSGSLNYIVLDTVDNYRNFSGVVNIDTYPAWLTFPASTASRTVYRMVTVVDCPHLHISDFIVTTEPTCLTSGVESTKCLDCGQIQETQSIPELAHIMPDDWTIDRAATCESTGEESKTCERGCGYREVEIIPATGHTMPNEPTFVIVPTCTLTGESVTQCEHFAQCGYQVVIAIDALGHEYPDTWTVETPSTCVIHGAEFRLCIRFSDCHTSQTRDIPFCDHTWIGGAVQSPPPTCTEPGMGTLICSVCGLENLDPDNIIPPLGHDFVEISRIPATCTHTGALVEQCTRCGEIQSTVIPLLEHSWGSPVTTTPTCTTAGFTVQICLVCGYEQIITTTAALGHSWGAWVVTTAATVTATGIKTRTCTRCGEVQSEVVPVIGDSGSSNNNQQPPPDSGSWGGGSWGGDDSSPTTVTPTTTPEVSTTPPTTPPTNGSDNVPAPAMPFTDLDGHWALSDGSIEFMWSRGIMKGISDTTFAPDAPLSRAMLITMLYRLAGEPEVEFSNHFNDVAPNLWYSNAASWGLLYGLTSGVGDNVFAPNDNVTREQIVTMLYNYAIFNGKNVTASETAGSEFSDFDRVSDWAVGAMRWAVHNALIHGYNGNLTPDTNATRAEVAALMTRFMELYEM